MTDSNYTHLSFLLDRSGSMQSIKSDTEGGFDAFIAEQRRQAGRCTVTLAQFDTEYEIVHDGVNIADVTALKLEPRGMTALLDSVARLIQDTGRHLAAMPEDRRPGTVIVGIMTDGLENSSKEWTRPAIKALIEEQERKYNWTFSYMGANQDAIEVGTSMGIAADQSLTYGTGAGDAAAAFSAYSASKSRLRHAVASGAPMPAARAAAAYVPAERAAAAGGVNSDEESASSGKPAGLRLPRPHRSAR
jgi:hypothetical protein